ncbi:hypothetical protein KAS41_03130 [Candidatus Parcubacteria bacterium]|nr:hypothetical protein [Candidatus Parcubacteria bacterium]
MSDENKNKNKNSDEELLDQSLDDELEIKETVDEIDDIGSASAEEETEAEGNISENSEEEIGRAGTEDSEEDERDQGKETVDKLSYVKSRLLKIQEEVKQILKYLDKEVVEENFTIEPALQEKLELKQNEDEEGQKIIEGVFDGKEMIGPDNKRYSVPSNYASKSQLVEGDIMKLIIKQDGTFVYKQISPVERSRLIGLLIKNEADSQFYAMVDSQRWQLLTASVTFFKGEAGDEIVILIPKGVKSKWAAVENIVRKS